MITWIQQNFTPITAGLAGIISLIAVIYTRNNIKTQKYIETITSQRIKWIDTLRNDLAGIISDLYLTHFADNSVIKYEEFMEHEGPEDLEQAISLDKYKNQLDALVGEFRENIKKTDLIRKIDISIMRLNQDDDQLLISELEKARKLVLKGCGKFGDTESLIISLRLEMSKILKNEWEKVKREVQKGGLVNGKRKKTFFKF
jgi:hypothetical protein